MLCQLGEVHFLPKTNTMFLKVRDHCLTFMEEFLVILIVTQLPGRPIIYLKMDKLIFMQINSLLP